MADPQGAEYLLFQPAPGQGEPARLQPKDPGAVDWRELITSDWEKAWEFYSKHYGWTKQNAVNMGAYGIYQTFMVDDVNGGGMMTALPEMGGSPSWGFYFTVDDIQSAAERVKKAGGTVLLEPMQVPGGGWTLKAVDPQGGAFALTAAK